MDADTVNQTEVETTKSQNNQNIDKEKIGITNDKEPEPNENQANGAVEEQKLEEDGEVGKPMSKTEESIYRFPERDRTAENGEGSEIKGTEVETDGTDPDTGEREEDSTNSTNYEIDAGTFLADPKTPEADENDIEEDRLKEEIQSKDVQDTTDEMDGDGGIQNKTWFGKEPQIHFENENVIYNVKMSETMKEDKNETEIDDKNIETNDKTDKDGVIKETDDENMVTDQKVVPDTETSTEINDVDSKGANEQEICPPDDRPRLTPTSDRDITEHVDLTNEADSEMAAEMNQGPKLADCEVAKPETTDISDKDSTSELASQKEEIAGERSNEVISRSNKKISEVTKTGECTGDETEIIESPDRDANGEHSEMRVELMEAVPKTNEILDECMDIDNDVEASIENALKECNENTDTYIEGEKHTEADLLGEGGSDGEDKENIDNIKVKPPGTANEMDRETCEVENEDDKNIVNDENNITVDSGSVVVDEGVQERTEDTADRETETPDDSEESETGKKELERSNLLQDSESEVSDGTCGPDTCTSDKHEAKEDESEVPDYLSVKASNDDGDDDGQEENMEVTAEGTDLSGTASKDVISKSNPTHLLAVGKCLEMFRASDKLCDFTINVNDTKFRVHKLIMCATSPAFLNLITTKDRTLSDMTVSSGVSVKAVKAFIHYLYTGELQLNDADLADVEKLASEYSVDSLKTVLDKNYETSKSVHTQTEPITEKVDLVKPKTVKSKQPISVQESTGKQYVSSETPKTDKSQVSSDDKGVTHKIGVSEADDDSRLLESDEDENDMDYGASIDDDNDDLLNNSPIDSDVVNNPSTSVDKDKDQRLGSTETQASKDSVNKTSSAKATVKTEPNMSEHKTTQQNLSKTSPRVRFPNIAAGLQALKEARMKREMGLNKSALSPDSEDRPDTVRDTQNETSTPKNQDKSLNLKVRVEKLPPNINENVTVVVNDDSDYLKDSEIEFVAEKSGEVKSSGVGYTKREFTLEEKEQIALEAKRYGTAQTAKARDIPLPDILSWMTFFGLRKTSENVSKKYGKQVNHEAELSIVRWIVQQQEVNGNVNLDAMRNYALAVYRQSQPNFVASKTWLANFFKRNISVLQGTSFVHGGDEESENQLEPVPVKLTQLPLLVDPALASIESQISEHETNMSRRSSTQDEDDMDISEVEHTAESVDGNEVTAEEMPSSSTNEIGSLVSETHLAESSHIDKEIPQFSADIAENLGLNLTNVTDFDSLGSIDNSVKPKLSTKPGESGLGGISKELLAKIKSKPVVIGTAVTFDAKTERRLAEWLIEKQQQDGYVYRDDFIEYARSLKKGHKSFRGTHGWIQLFMRRNSVKLPFLKQVVLKSKFKTYYSDQEKLAIVQQARMLGVPHVAKLLGINSGVIHSWKVGMDAEERKKGGPKNFEKVTRSVTRAFPSVSKEVDERIDNTLKEQIKARIDVETRRKSSVSANRGPDPELESEAIAKIKEAGIVRYQDVQKICFEVYSKKRPDFQASKSWVLKFVNNHVLGLEGVELLKSWFVYPEKNQLRLKYEDKMSILEDEKIYGVEETAKRRNISCGTIRFWKKYPPSPEDDADEKNETGARSSNRRGTRTNDFEYVPSKFQAGKKVRRRVVIGEAVMFTPEQELQLVQWIHDHMMEDESVYTDDFRQFAKSLYTGDKIFSASSTWMTKFIRRNPVLQGVNFISKYKRFFTEEEKYAAVLEARRFGTSYVAKKLNADSGLINAWKMKFAKYSAKRMAKLKQNMQLDRAPLTSLVVEREALPPVVRPAEIENPDMSLEEIEKEVGSGLHSYSGAVPVYEREIVRLIKDENEQKGGVTYEDISRLCRSVYEKTRPHFRASYNWTQEFIKRNEEALGDVNILNRKKVFVEDDEPLNASTSKMYRRDRNGSEPADVSPLLQRIMSKKPILLGQSRTLDPQNERKLVQWMVQKQQEDGYVFVDEFNEYAKSLYKGTKKFAATQAWRILFFKRNKAALKGVKLESKYRKQFTREEKLAIVAEARRLGIGHVARKLDVNSSLIYSWGFGKTPQLTQDELANKDIEQDVGKGLYSQRGTVPTLENEIVKKILEMQNKEGSVSYSDISKICIEVYKETRPNFKASYNWTMEFIKRHKDELRGVDIENMKKVYYGNEDDEQPGLQSFISTLNQNMDTNISDSLVRIENLEHGHDIDFNAHSFEESDLNLNDLIDPEAANLVKQEPMDHSGADPEAMDEETSAAVLERIRASKPDIVAQPKTFDMEAEKKMVKWVNERQERDGYVFSDDFVAYAKSLYTGPETFSGSQTWKKNFLRRHRKEVGNIVFRSKLVNQYTEEEREMVLEEARKFGVGYVAKQCGIDHKLVWSWKVRADQNQKTKQNAFWKGPKKTTSVISKPSHVKHAAPRPIASEPEEPLGDACRGMVPEFEDRIIRTIIEYQNREGSISYEEISEISREIYQETRPNFKAGYGWIKNFLERHKNRLKNIDIENMKKLFLPDDDAIVRATGKNIREASERGATDVPLGSETSEGGSLESLQRLIAKKPIVIGVPKSFNAKTEKKLVLWLLDQQAEQGYAFLDEFKEYASSLYAGDKKFAATNAWRTLFFRRNHSALKNVKIVSKFRKTFTEEEKIAIVKEAKRLGVGHVSRQLDIGHGNINVWMRELEAKGRITSGVVESPSVVSESSNGSITSVKDKGKRKQSMERSSSTDSRQSRQSSKERLVTADEGQEEMDTGSGLYSARGIVPVFEKQIIEEVLEYYRVNESIKYDDISRISQNIYKETRPTFKASHNWIKDFMSRHSEKVGHLVIQNAREFLTNKEKREVLAEVDKHGLQYVSKVTNISQAQLLAWKDQLSNAPPSEPVQPSTSTPSTPVQTPTTEPSSSITPPVQGVPGVRARKYSLEEKKMYAAECEKHGVTFVSSHYSVPKTNLGRWMAQFKTHNEEPELPEAPLPSEPEEEVESKVVPMLDSNDTSDVDKVITDWILERKEDIGVVVVTYLLDFAQEIISKSDPGFQATEEWLLNFLTKNSTRFKGIKFRYPEEVTKNFLQNFTQQEKDKLCEAAEKLNKPVVEIATLAGILPHTLYDWRKNYKRKKLRESYETPSPVQTKKGLGASQSKNSPSPSLSKSSPGPSNSKILPALTHSKSPALLVPKSEPVDPDELDGKSKMQEKLSKIENKYNAIQKQEIADEARKDGTSSVAKGRGIPLPLVLKWMKMFPETVPTVSESTPKSRKTSTPKSGSESRSKSTESTPKSTVNSPGLGSKATETKDTSLKVKLPVPTKTYTYKSKQVAAEEKRRFALEARAEGATTVCNRTGIPKSTLYSWGKQLDEEEALEKKQAAEEKKKQADKNDKSSKSGTPDVSVKNEAVDLDSFTEDQRKEIALETKSFGFEETAKKRGIPTAVVIEWMGLYLDQSPTVSEKELVKATTENSATVEKTVTPKRVYTEEEKCKIAEQALEIGPKETARLTGVHHSNVHRWMNSYKKRLKGRQYAMDRKGRGQSTQSKNEKRHQMIQGIMRENSQTDSQTSEQNLSRSNSLNSESDAGTEFKAVGEFTFEDKLRVLQAADEMGVRNASVKFKVDPALIFQWRRLYDYTDASNPTVATSTATSTSSTTDTTLKLKASSSIATSTPKTTSTLNPLKKNTSHVPTASFTGSNEFDSIVISDDEGSCSPCSNHSWQSDDMTEESPHKRKSDFGETDLNFSAKRSRLDLSQSFGMEDDVSSDVIDFAYTPEQKQSVVRDSNIYGLEKVSKMTNIPESLIISWKAQFPNVSSVKTEKR